MRLPGPSFPANAIIIDTARRTPQVRTHWRRYATVKRDFGDARPEARVLNRHWGGYENSLA